MNPSPDKTSILVTGGTGFVGSYLLRYLVNTGYTNIRATKRSSSAMDLVAPVQDQIEWVEADLLDVPALEDAMEGITQVYHCAALISFSPKDVSKMMTINQKGTENVVNIALHKGIKKLVHVSSIAALGRNQESNIVSEKDKWERHKQNSNYSISKYLAEQEVWRGMAEGLQVAIVNPAVILGAGRWNEGPLKLFGLVWKNFPFYPKGVSGFVDVRDVARFMIQVMESDISGERFILSSENLSFKGLQEDIASELNRNKPSILVSPFIQEVAWRLERLRGFFLPNHDPLITRETAAHSSKQFHYSNDKSKQFLSFSYIPIQQTIQETSKLFLEASKNNFSSKFLDLY